MSLEVLFRKDVLEMIERLKGNFTLIDFGFPEGKVAFQERLFVQMRRDREQT